MESIRPNLVMLHGGKSSKPELEGPVTRLGLGDRLGHVTPRMWVWIGIAKLAVLASLFYVAFG